MLEWLKEIIGEAYTEDVDKKVSAEIGKRFVSKDDFNTKNTELKTVQGQLDEANQTIQSYKDMDIDGIKQSAADWETKYNADTQKLKDDLAAERYSYAVKDAVAGMKFSSESAKKAFVAAVTEKALPVQDGKLLGLDDFTKAFREEDPGAFAPDGKTPAFARGTGGGTPSNQTLDSLRSAFGLPPKNSD